MNKPVNLTELFEKYRKEEQSARIQALKELYQSSIAGLFYKDNPFIKMIPKSNPFNGTSYPIPKKKRRR